IRRPFLYSGTVQGLLGGILAWLLVGLGLLLLSDPAHRLASLYGSLFAVENMGFLATLALIGTGGLLGWVGSRLAVGRHLRATEPR
ncbi:MAG: cell division protein, partial [Gammaproteobacteria bacterium]|nr:cell division protein [Gammaproteobacteria bacterium]